jgi:hypothetical protein
MRRVWTSFAAIVGRIRLKTSVQSLPQRRILGIIRIDAVGSTHLTAAAAAIAVAIARVTHVAQMRKRRAHVWSPRRLRHHQWYTLSS